MLSSPLFFIGISKLNDIFKIMSFGGLSDLATSLHHVISLTLFGVCHARRDIFDRRLRFLTDGQKDQTCTGELYQVIEYGA